MQKYYSLTRQATWVSLGRILTVPITFLVPVVLARYLSMEEFGIYKQLMLIFYLVLPILCAGLPQSLLFFIPTDESNTESYINNCVKIQTVISVLFLIIIYFNRKRFSLFFTKRPEFEVLLVCISLFLIFWSISETFPAILMAEKKAKGVALVNFISGFGRAFFTILVVLLKGNLFHVTYVLIATGFVRCGAMFIYIYKKIRPGLFQINKKLFRSQLHYSMPLWFSQIIRSFFDYSHNFIVSFFMGPKLFAVYSVGCFQIPILYMLLDSISQVSLVKCSELYSKAEYESVSNILSNSIRKIWIILFPLFVYLFINARQIIIFLFTEEYIDSVPIFRVFVLIIPVSALLVDYLPRACNDTTFILKNNLLSLFVSVVMVTLLLKSFGLFGAVTGFFISKLVWKFDLLYKSKSLLNVRITQIIPVKLVIKISFLTLFAGAVNWCINAYANIHIVFLLMVTSVTFFSIYIISLWKFDIFIQDEKKYLFKILGKIHPKLQKDL